MNLNKCQFIGRVTKDPELKALPSGNKVCSFSIATNRVWKDQNGEKKDQVEFINFTAFGKTAETIGTYVKKGQLIYCEGRMQTRSWDGQDGKKMYRTEIVLETFQFGPKAAGQGGETTTRPAVRKNNDEVDTIEFPDDEGSLDGDEEIPF